MAMAICQAPRRRMAGGLQECQEDNVALEIVLGAMQNLLDRHISWNQKEAKMI